MSTSCFHLTFTDSNGPTFTFTNKFPSPFPLVSTCCFYLTFTISHGPYFHFHQLIHIAALFIIFHLTFTRSNGPFFHIHQRCPLLSSFCRSDSAIQFIPTFIFTKWYCYHCRNSSCFHSMSLFTHSTGPHFIVFTVALPLVGLRFVNFSLQIDPLNSSQVSPICPHRPPPSICHPHSYHQLIVVTRLLSV